MNEIIIYVALGIVGLFTLIGVVMLFAFAVIASVASAKGFKQKKKLQKDLESEYNQKLADHKRENLKLILKKEIEVDDEITAKKLEKYSKKRKKD